ncbi:hypothetical protein Tco_0828521, partial [Tanacetum coccineum]
QIPSSQASSRRGGSSNSSYRKDDYNRRYDGDDSEDIMRTSAALENLQLDRKTRNLTNSWRHGGDGSSEEDGRSQSQASSGGRRSITPEQDSLSSFDSRNRRSSSSSVVWGLPPLGRQIPSSQASCKYFSRFPMGAKDEKLSLWGPKDEKLSLWGPKGVSPNVQDTLQGQCNGGTNTRQLGLVSFNIHSFIHQGTPLPHVEFEPLSKLNGTSIKRTFDTGRPQKCWSEALKSKPVNLCWSIITELAGFVSKTNGLGMSAVALVPAYNLKEKTRI